MATTNNIQKKYVVGIYDTRAGAMVDTATTAGSPHTLVSSTVVPIGSLIDSVKVDTKVTFAGGANTLQVHIGGVNVTKAMSIAERSTTVPFSTLLGPVVTTNAEAMNVTVAVANITDGYCRIIIGYFEPAAA
jgi:hypothetical protein